MEPGSWYIVGHEEDDTSVLADSVEVSWQMPAKSDITFTIFVAAKSPEAEGGLFTLFRGFDDRP